MEIYTNPIHVEYNLSLGDAILILQSFIFNELNTIRFRSFSSLSPKPLNKVDPPDNTMF